MTVEITKVVTKSYGLVMMAGCLDGEYSDGVGRYVSDWMEGYATSSGEWGYLVRNVSTCVYVDASVRAVYDGYDFVLDVESGGTLLLFGPCVEYAASSYGCVLALGVVCCRCMWCCGVCTYYAADGYDSVWAVCSVPGRLANSASLGGGVCGPVYSGATCVSCEVVALTDVAGGSSAGVATGVVSVVGRIDDESSVCPWDVPACYCLSGDSISLSAVSMVGCWVMCMSCLTPGLSEADDSWSFPSVIIIDSVLGWSETVEDGASR